MEVERSLTKKERDAIDEDDFAGPDHSFPIDTQAHLDAAAHLIGHAADPDAVKKKAIAIAKRKGFTLPKAWQDEEDGKERMETPDVTRDDEDEERHAIPVIVRADGSHAPFKGSHSHSHPAFGSQGDDENHAHSHSHDGDADHSHSHDRADEPDILRAMQSDFHFFAPIVRIDKAKREVTVRATSEREDSYGTVFDFNASTDAFSRWHGNIREMHQNKSVGRGLEWIERKAQKAVDLTLRVSRGAPDTWEKLLDGTLMGASIGAKNGTWEKRTINGKEVPVLTRYDLVEVSLVDNPANPDCTIQIVRADGLTTEVLDDTPDENSQPTDTRAGKTISAATAGKMHQSMLHSLQAAKTSADMCNCDGCQAVSQALDPDQDGDIDIIPELDTDGDQGGAGDVEASLRPTIERIIKETIEQTLQPTVQRYSAIAARLAQTDTPDITRRLDDVAGLKTELSEARSLMSEVKAITESYANRAQSGGPVVNTGNMRGGTPAPLAPQQLAAHYAPFVELLIKQGIIRDREQQIQANLLVQQLANGG